MNGTDDFYFWKDSSYGVKRASDVVLDNILTELNTLVGFADRKAVVFTAPSWTDGYVLSGVEANGNRVYRLTPDPTQSVSVSTAGGDVTFTIGGKVVSIPNATIYTPANPTSTLGYWIVQTQGTTSLTKSVVQVRQLLNDVLKPIVTGPNSGVHDAAQSFTDWNEQHADRAERAVCGGYRLEWRWYDGSVGAGEGSTTIDAYFTNLGVTDCSSDGPLAR